MLITSLSLKNFRNYEQETFTFGEGLNVIVGPNAQGKTNCAEAIFLACTGYSPRANRDAQLILYGKDRAEISCACRTLYGEVKVEVGVNRGDKKSVKINGVKILKIGELFGNVNSVFFNPMELKLVQESPEDRRRFMNIALSQMNKNYFYALTRYNKVLEQRKSS